MTKKHEASSSRRDRLREWFIRGLPAWLVLLGLLTIVVPNLSNVVDHFRAVDGYVDDRRLARTVAPLFTPEVDYWHDDIVRWAQVYSLDPNLVATVIQIESCGDPNVSSPAGAQGLMQVMPQHFAPSEDPLDPDTNVRRGLEVLVDCLSSPYNPQYDVGLAFACYNGGPSVFVNAWDYWPQQARDYYIWGTGIYADAQANQPVSETLERWLLAGGDSLCVNARQWQGLTPAP